MKNKEEMTKFVKGKSLDLMTCVNNYEDWKERCEKVMEIVNKLDTSCRVITRLENGKIETYKLIFEDSKSTYSYLSYNEFIKKYEELQKEIVTLTYEDLDDYYTKGFPIIIEGDFSSWRDNKKLVSFMDNWDCGFLCPNQLMISTRRAIKDRPTSPIFISYKNLMDLVREEWRRSHKESPDSMVAHFYKGKRAELEMLFSNLDGNLIFQWKDEQGHSYFTDMKGKEMEV